VRTTDTFPAKNSRFLIFYFMLIGRPGAHQ